MKNEICGSSNQLRPPSALDSGDHVESSPETGGRRNSPAQALEYRADAVYGPPATCQSIIESAPAVKDSPRAILLFYMTRLKETKVKSSRDDMVAIARHGIEDYASGHPTTPFRWPTRSPPS